MIYIKWDGETIRHFLKRASAWTLEDELDAYLMRGPHWRSMVEL